MLWELFLRFLAKITFFTGAIVGKNSFPKPLPPEEERAYLKRVQAGDKEAKDVLVKHNMRLVAHIVKKYSGAAETSTRPNSLFRLRATPL